MNRKGDRNRRKRGVPPMRKRAYVCEVAEGGLTHFFGTFAQNDRKAVEIFKNLAKEARGKMVAVHVLRGELPTVWCKPPWNVSRTIFRKA